jgi:hypothetical protein
MAQPLREKGEWTSAKSKDRTASGIEWLPMEGGANDQEQASQTGPE